MVDRVIVWHRRDLRLQDHPALDWVGRRGCATIGIFIFDPAILHGPEPQRTTGGGQVAFMLDCLRELRDNYRRLGSDLYFFLADPVQCLTTIAAILRPDHVLFCADVEPFALERDNRARSQLARLGVRVTSFVDLGLHPPDAILTGAGEPYKVFTPFWRNWSKQAKPQPWTTPAQLVPIEGADKLPAIALPSLESLGFQCQQTIPKGGEAMGRALLDQFTTSNAILRYDSQRNFPAVEGTSRLSPHLRFGTIGIRSVWRATVEAEGMIRSREDELGIQGWRQELAWREFYHHVLFFFPELAERAYRPPMQKFRWHDRGEHFQAWCAGRTGYPIVDAAMRQLNQTGWMHNRCRMIVASFLTKDLLINWQWGERYFMQKLVDGELAANNGGWQWSASSGMDAKPLRIFNPASQASKFDPDGDYMRQWLPELRSVSTAELVSGQIDAFTAHRCNYPLPIVDHKQQQQLFKQEYARVKGDSTTHDSSH